MRQRADMRRAAVVVLSVLTMLMLVGCISSHSDVTYGSKGPAVRSDTLRQIQCGETTKGWLLGVLGEPSRTAQTAEGTEILTYEYTKTVESNFSFFIFFDADDHREERTVHLFEIEDGIVTKHWEE